jgi:hypothetical protein
MHLRQSLSKAGMVRNGLENPSSSEGACGSGYESFCLVAWFREQSIIVDAKMRQFAPISNVNWQSRRNERYCDRPFRVNNNLS